MTVYCRIVVFLNAYLSAGPFVQCLRSQHSLHHHLYFVHCDLQYSHILPRPCAPGKHKHKHILHLPEWLLFNSDKHSAIILPKEINTYTYTHLSIYCMMLCFQLGLPSWPTIALVQSTQNAPLLRMPSLPTSWTLRSLSPPSLRLPTILLSTPAALRRTLRGKKKKTTQSRHFQFLFKQTTSRMTPHLWSINTLD